MKIVGTSALLLAFMTSTNLTANMTSANAAPSCAIAGDSIAAGVSLRECAKSARIGIPSAAVIGRVPPGVAVAVISAGSNDPCNSRLRTNLEAIRARAHAAHYVWILPVSAPARAAVAAVAARHHDRSVAFRPGRDGVHPSSYQLLSQAIRAQLRAGAGG